MLQEKRHNQIILFIPELFLLVLVFLSWLVFHILLFNPYYNYRSNDLHFIESLGGIVRYQLLQVILLAPSFALGALVQHRIWSRLLSKLLPRFEINRIKFVLLLINVYITIPFLFANQEFVSPISRVGRDIIETLYLGFLFGSVMMHFVTIKMWERRNNCKIVLVEQRQIEGDMLIHRVYLVSEKS